MDPALDPALARLIAEAGGALQASLDDITLAALNGDDPHNTVTEARELADALTSAVFLLDEGAEAEQARRRAARLVANLALLEKLIGEGLALH